MTDWNRADLISLDPNVDRAEQNDPDEGADNADDHGAGNADGSDPQDDRRKPPGSAADNDHDQNLVDTADQCPHLHFMIVVPWRGESGLDAGSALRPSASGG